MNELLKSYLLIIFYLIIGFILLGAVQQLQLPYRPNAAFILLSLFVVVNLVTLKIFRLSSEIKAIWSIKKLFFLPIGIIIGGLIPACSIVVGLLAKKITLNELTLKTAFTISSISVTLAIVTWEELWFRGIFLNECNKKISEINLSITIGLLFMLVHILNPEINLLKTGPVLFFAGAFLTSVYFYFKTIWLPIGLHFGNNYLALQSNIENHWFLGNEGYFNAIILAGLFLLFVKLTLNKTKGITRRQFG